MRNLGFSRIIKNSVLYFFVSGAYFYFALFSELEAVRNYERYLAFFFGVMAARIIVS